MGALAVAAAMVVAGMDPLAEVYASARLTGDESAALNGSPIEVVLEKGGIWCLKTKTEIGHESASPGSDFDQN